MTLMQHAKKERNKETPPPQKQKQEQNRCRGGGGGGGGAGLDWTGEISRPLLFGHVRACVRACVRVSCEQMCLCEYGARLDSWHLRELETALAGGG